MATGPCRVYASGQIMHDPCGWTTDVQRTGNVFRCCKCGSRFEWRDGDYLPAVPTRPALTTLRAAGKAVATVGQIALGLAVLAFGMWSISQHDECDCDSAGSGGRRARKGS